MSPVYEYECPECGEFEVVQRITENKLKVCPDCNSKVKKLISNVHFYIKGGMSSVPTNEQLGMPSERTLLQNMESPYAGEEMRRGRKLSIKEREAFDYNRKQVASEKAKKDKRIQELKNKHPEFAAKLDKAMKEGKNRSPKDRELARRKRAKSGIKSIDIDRAELANKNK